jgi:hypothetical protein
MHYNTILGFTLGFYLNFLFYFFRILVVNNLVVSSDLVPYTIFGLKNLKIKARTHI